MHCLSGQWEAPCLTPEGRECEVTTPFILRQTEQQWTHSPSPALWLLFSWQVPAWNSLYKVREKIFATKADTLYLKWKNWVSIIGSLVSICGSIYLWQLEGRSVVYVMKKVLRCQSFKCVSVSIRHIQINCINGRFESGLQHPVSYHLWMSLDFQEWRILWGNSITNTETCTPRGCPGRWGWWSPRTEAGPSVQRTLTWVSTPLFAVTSFLRTAK